MDDLLEDRIAAELRAEVRRQNRTGRWLAGATGLTVGSVARWLRADRSPGFNELDLMCQALGLTVTDLLQRVEVTGGYRRTPLLPAASLADSAPLAQLAEQLTLNQRVRGHEFVPRRAVVAPGRIIAVAGRRRRHLSVVPQHVRSTAA